MRSKRTVVLLILGGMLALFAAGVLYRTFRPSAVERVMRQLPRYPGARELEEQGPGAAGWSDYAARGNPEGEARLIAYRLPRGTTRTAVRAFYRDNAPREWRRVTQDCFARGDVRIRLLVQATNELDVLVADNVKCR